MPSELPFIFDPDPDPAPDSGDAGIGTPTLPPPVYPADDAGAAPPAGIEGFRDMNEYLRELAALDMPAARKAAILGTLYRDGVDTVEARLPALSEIYLPIPRRPRQVIREMQDALEMLATLLLDPDGRTNENYDPPPGDGIAPLALWRVLHLLSRHLLISSLTAAPPGAGIWRRLHRAYSIAVRQGVTHELPEGATISLRDKYYAAVLLGCAQPTSFTGPEVLFLDTYLGSFAEQVETGQGRPEDSPVAFWIDPQSDRPATPYSRKPPTPDTPVHSFSCQRLASLLESQLAALDAGAVPDSIGVPAFAATPAGIGVLNRLVQLWGNPGKRRFPRRRQNRRVDLCLGFDKLCRLYKGASPGVDASSWMITNESPDGYAVMHLSGETRSITAGNVVALRTESAEDWLLCIIRWVLSENQEHIELGLQILASRAYAADIALPAEPPPAGESPAIVESGTVAESRPALILPATPLIRPNEALVVRSGALAGRSKDLVLVIERDNVEIREIGSLHCDERNGLIELYGIAPGEKEAGAG
ncbi:MAG: hypothetical protein LBS70_03850 [Candidatus Accumulibacter sp.]|jgi:hypothetical protein|nr:hypothetical protein [Accumulibacter sp.]